MRKIISKYEVDKRKRRNQFIVGGALIFLLVISTVGYAFQGHTQNSGGAITNTTTYNGVSFSYQNGFWVTEYNNQRIAFRYSPSQINSDLLNITKGINDFLDKTVYIYSEDANSTSELSVNLAGFVSQIITMQNLASKDCSKNSIIVEKSLTNSVSQQQNCILISGQEQDLIALSDSVMFKLFGIKG